MKAFNRLRVAIIFAGILMMTCGCKKSTSIKNTMSLTVNGVNWPQLNDVDFATSSPGALANALSVHATNEADKYMLDLDIQQTNPITTGSYIENPGGTDPLVSILAGQTTSTFYGSYHSTLSPSHITITEINSTYVSGTFSGELKDPFGPGKINVTNGSFTIAFQ